MFTGGTIWVLTHGRPWIRRRFLGTQEACEADESITLFGQTQLKKLEQSLGSSLVGFVGIIGLLFGLLFKNWGRFLV